MIKHIKHLEESIRLPSPLTPIRTWNESHEVSYYIKRDDLIDPYISGNKYRKLKGQLIHYLSNISLYPSGILTYGGAYSNHLYATAGACSRLDIPLTAIVRGEEVDLTNHTLSYLVHTGTTIHRISRSDYALKEKAPLVKMLLDTHQYLEIPEGGNAPLAESGVRNITDEILSQITPDYLCIASGTGTTARYILQSIKGKRIKLIIYSAVRDQSVKDQILELDTEDQVTWIDEQWGGFARSKPELLESISTIEHSIKTRLEHVYTGKLFVEIQKLKNSNYFPAGSKVVVIHTGGLRPSNHDLTTLG